jgi:cytochrome c
MKLPSGRCLFWLSTALIGATLLSKTHAETVLAFTQTQAQKGQEAYERSCARCHGADLEGGEFGPRLLSGTFIQHWAGHPVSGLLSFIKTSMPPGQAGKLPASSYVRIVAYLLESYGVRPGDATLPSETAALDALMIPKRSALEPYIRDGGIGLSPGVTYRFGRRLEPTLSRNSRDWTTHY